MKYSSIKTAVLFGALVLAACSNGSKDKTPSLSIIANQSVNQDTAVGPIAFKVDDDEGPENVIVSASSSNAVLLPTAGIVLAGSGADRTIALTPAEEVIGTATITLTAKDATGRMASRSFNLQVNAVNVSFLARSKEVFSRDANEQPQSLQGFTFTQDADDDAMAYDDLVGP